MQRHGRLTGICRGPLGIPSRRAFSVGFRPSFPDYFRFMYCPKSIYSKGLCVMGKLSWENDGISVGSWPKYGILTIEEKGNEKHKAKHEPKRTGPGSGRVTSRSKTRRGTVALRGPKPRPVQERIEAVPLTSSVKGVL